MEVVNGVETDFVIDELVRAVEQDLWQDQSASWRLCTSL